VLIKQASEALPCEDPGEGLPEAVERVLLKALARNRRTAMRTWASSPRHWKDWQARRLPLARRQ